nr:sarcinarray family MAST domain-containing protein [Methanosarcina lacustris]
MKAKYLIIVLILISTINLATAYNPYGNIYTYDVYYDDKLLPGIEVAKPILKIGEPFQIRIDFTTYQKCYVSAMISEIGNGNFIVVDGPTKKTNVYCGKIFEENSTEIFEWTVKPTENWAGGSLPIDFYYQVDELGAGGKTLANGGFTVAYPYISNEHYEGEIPISEEQPVSETEPSSKSTSTPAFSLVTAISAFVLVFLRFSRQ